jgi:lysozyme
MRIVNAAGVALVKKWEGVLDGDPYLDPVGIWTIGWGHAIVDPETGRYVRGNSAASAARAKALYPDGLTLTQAEALLEADLMDASVDVAALVKVPMSDNAFAALTSFHFNLGKLGASTLLQKLNAGDRAGAANEFGRWVKGRDPKTGTLVTLPGLVARRSDERTLFLS